MTPVRVSELLDRTRLPIDVRAYLPVPDDDSPAPQLLRLRDLLEKKKPILKPREWWKTIRTVFPQWDRLPFNMQPQQQSNWCWAAVSTSVSVYYTPGSSWTQCLVANAQLGRNDCCGGGASGPCNVYGYLDQALQTVGNFASMQGGTVTFSVLDGQIETGRPVGVRVAWSGGGAHFLAVIGALDSSPDYVAVDDSIYGKSDITYSTLVSGYQGSGTWTHTYFTEP